MDKGRFQRGDDFHVESRRVTVAELPDCYFKERLTEIVIDPEVATVYVVAREGQVGDWACYIGWPEASHVKSFNISKFDVRYNVINNHEAMDVAEHGDKLEKSAALALFPSWSHLKYRD